MRRHLFWLLVAVVAGVVAHTAFALFVPGWWFSRQVAALSHAHGKNSFFILSPEEQARLFPGLPRFAAAQQWLGNSGIYVVSALSGLADVDAIVISLARSYSDQGLSDATVLIALALATSANMLTKVSIAWTTAGHRVGQSIGGGYAIALLFGAMASALVIFLK